ncbi:MAG: hypothetical protein MK089_12720, partial [Phycisphaerales bacterium]|nr:hypothetical protein [Phycisphaerales bacterium]
LPVTLGFLLCLLGIGSLIGAMLTVASLQTALIAVGGFGYVFGVIMLFLATPRAYGLLGQRELVPVYWIGLIVVSLIPPFGWALLMILIFAIGTIRPAKKWSLGAVASSQFADETERFMNDLASMPDPERHLYWYNSLGQELEMKADKSSKRRMRRRQAKSRNSEQS